MKRVSFAAGLAGIAMAAVLAAAPAEAITAMPEIQSPSNVIPVSGGCGPYARRGPYGGCRHTPYYGPLPNGYYQPRPMANGCPPGYWRGPWGHCRNTPYHGRLPNGGYQ